MQPPRYILLAEDSLPTVELFLAAAKIHSPELVVEHAGDGVEALDFLHARGRFRDRSDTTPPALILLDLKMPRVDGLQVLREIRNDEVFKSIPVVVMTSSRDESDLRDTYRLGANGYVVKPLSFSELKNAVGVIVDFWVSLNEPPPAVVPPIPPARLPVTAGI